MFTNHVEIIGRLVAPIDLRTTKSDKSIATFSVAINEGPNTYFVKCVAWEGFANAIAHEFTKGTEISIIGKIRTNPYADKNGIRRTDFYILVEDFYHTSIGRRFEVTECCDDIPF